jgi:hypothetical protein
MSQEECLTQEIKSKASCDKALDFIQESKLLYSNAKTSTDIYKKKKHPIVIKVMKSQVKEVLYSSIRYEMLAHLVMNRLYDVFQCHHVVRCHKIQYCVGQNSSSFVAISMEQCDTNVEVLLKHVLKSPQRFPRQEAHWIISSLLMQCLISILQVHTHLGISHNDAYTRNFFIQSSSSFFTFYRLPNSSFLVLPLMGGCVKIGDFGVVTSSSWTPSYHIFGATGEPTTKQMTDSDLPDILKWRHSFEYSNLHWQLRDYFALIHNFYSLLSRFSSFQKELSWCEYFISQLWKSPKLSIEKCASECITDYIQTEFAALQNITPKSLHDIQSFAFVSDSPIDLESWTTSTLKKLHLDQDQKKP